MNLENVISILKNLISIDTSNPPGNEEEICNYIQEIFSNFGIISNLISFAPERPSLYAIIEGKEPGSVIFSGHLDTVAPLGTWTKEPLKPVEEEGKIFGLGSADMKGGVAVLIEALRFIKEKGKPKYTVKLLLSADEELKYRGAEVLQKNGILEDAIFSIIAEPTDNKVFIGEKSEFWLRVTFIGKEAHGSTPEEGINAIINQAKFILALKEEFKSLGDVPIMGRPSLNIGKIQGGRQPNIVPEKCSLDLDFRLVNEEQKIQVEKIIEKLGSLFKEGGQFYMETLSYKRPLVSNPESLFIKNLFEVVEKITHLPQQAVAASYCTDLPTLFPKKTPPFVIFGPGNIKQAHQPDEFIEIGSLKDSVYVFSEFIERILF